MKKKFSLFWGCLYSFFLPYREISLKKKIKTATEKRKKGAQGAKKII